MDIDKEIKFLERGTFWTPVIGLIICFLLLFLSTGCSGTWVWQEDYPKHRTTFLKCPQWNYNEAYEVILKTSIPVFGILQMEERRLGL
jgi:hypothetical protein